MKIRKLAVGLLGLALAAAMAQADGPAISCKRNGSNFIVTYTGELYQSMDAVKWTAVPGATSPYLVTMSDKKRFFCAKGEKNPFTIDLVWIEPGTFMMGSPEDDPIRDDDETLHEVTLTQGYWMGKYEVTQGQYQAIMGYNPSNQPEPYDVSGIPPELMDLFPEPDYSRTYGIGDDYPVYYVTRRNALDFCTKLTSLYRREGRLPLGYSFTLPTEAQWEYACRAGTTTPLNSGKDIPEDERYGKLCLNVDEVAWYSWNSGDRDDNGQTYPVGQKKPNAWGLYDMHGNVSELCLDWYDDYPTGPVTDPTGPIYPNMTKWILPFRVARGASWEDSAVGCTSSQRGTALNEDYVILNGIRIDAIGNNYGFRVVLAPNRDMKIPLAADVSMNMIWIEPSAFVMGSPTNELGRWNDETQHYVSLSEGYWIGQYEVTQAQYQAVMGTNPSHFKGADLPVEQVSWFDAKEFCKKLTEREKAAGRLPAGYEYTLPTEAQWEFACRGWTLTALNNEKNLSDEEECPEVDEAGWYEFNSNMTQPVGKKQANNFGLFDMHGNVCEWCLDWFDDYPTGATAADPTGPDTGTERVHRGGCWYYEANECRSAFRNCMDPNDEDRTIGFRVVLSPVHQDDDTPGPGPDDPPDDPPVGDPTPGKNVTIPLSDTVKLELIWVEPGTFTMGSPTDEQGRWNNETQHEVTLTYGYWLGKYELTQAQYEAVIGSNPSFNQGADLPVECITFYGAQSFCSNLTRIEREAGRLSEKYVYTIPSEAQWEYACRAGTAGPYNVDGVQLSELAWYTDNSGGATHPVGQKRPNAWGFYDMHGNVYEWCWDTYGSYPTSPVTDPMGASWGSYTVIRGGSCMSSSDDCRSAFRYYTYEYNGYNNLGLRVAIVPAE